MKCFHKIANKVALGVEAAVKNALSKKEKLDPPLTAVRIEADGAIAKVFVNGEQLKGVRSYALAQSRDGFPILNVELVCGSIVSDISDTQIMYAPTPEGRGREQDEEDYGWLKDAMARSDESDNAEQVDSDSFANANR